MVRGLRRFWPAPRCSQILSTTRSFFSPERPLWIAVPRSTKYTHASARPERGRHQTKILRESQGDPSYNAPCSWGRKRAETSRMPDMSRFERFLWVGFVVFPGVAFTARDITFREDDYGGRNTGVSAPLQPSCAEPGAYGIDPRSMKICGERGCSVFCF